MKIYLSSAALALLGGASHGWSSTWLASPGSRGSGVATVKASQDVPSVVGAGAPLTRAELGWVHDKKLDSLLADALKDTGIPGAVGAVVQLGKDTRIGSAGVRKQGSEVLMGPADLVHIGSDTKAMTAVLVARLVQQGVLSWDQTIGETLPDSGSFHADFQNVTVAQLLRHVAGLPGDPPNWWAYGEDEIRVRRMKLVREALSQKPAVKPGSKHSYSNLSVVVAGVMAEVACDAPWEELMQREVFGPLGMASASFGAPGKPGEIDQPWGHMTQPDGSLLALQVDNNPALGPAGTVHLSMADWAKFVSIFLEDAAIEGDPGEGGAAMPSSNVTPAPFLSKASRQALLAPGVGGTYGMGWILLERGWADGQTLTHSGSNRSWFANAWVAPEVDVAFLVAANAFTPGTPAQLDGFIGQCVLGMLADKSGPLKGPR